MHKLPNDLLILHNQPLTAVQPIALSSFQTLHTEKLKVLDKKCIEINSWAGRNLACVSGTFVISWVFSLCQTEYSACSQTSCSSAAKKRQHSSAITNPTSYTRWLIESNGMNWKN